MNLRDEIRHKVNNLGAGGWKQLAESKPEVLTHLTDLISRSSIKNDIPNMIKTLNEILAGNQHVTDFDTIMILRSHE